MATCNTKIGKDGNISPVHCQNFEGAKVQLFEGRKRISIVFYSHFRKLHLCTLNFLYLLFSWKIKAIELPRTPSNKDSAKVRENHSCSFSTAAHTNASSFTGCLHAENLHFHLCFGGQGGDVGLVPCSLCQLRNARGSVLRPFTFFAQGEKPAKTTGLFSGPEKARKIGDVNAGLPSKKPIAAVRGGS